VRVAGNDYSVDPTVIGRMIEVAAGLDEVIVTADGRQWARHRRAWAARLTITDPAHVETAARLHAVFAPSKRGGEADLVGDLGDYDWAFGVVDLDGRVA
jgi:hypothetical protein